MPNYLLYFLRFSLLSVLNVPQLFQELAVVGLNYQSITLTSFIHFSFSFNSWNGFFPVQSSKHKIPIAQMSRRGPVSRPCTYSGDRYSKVPMISFASIFFWLVNLLAYPKSQSLILPLPNDKKVHFWSWCFKFWCQHGWSLACAYKRYHGGAVSIFRWLIFPWKS